MRGQRLTEEEEKEAIELGMRDVTGIDNKGSLDGLKNKRLMNYIKYTCWRSNSCLVFMSRG